MQSFIRTMVAAALLGPLLVVGTTACGDQADSGEMTELKLSINQENLAKGVIILEAELINYSDEEITFLPWNTPLEGRMLGDYLSVTEKSNGARLAYQGLMVKRAAPTDADYVSLKSGESISGSVVISNSYPFCANTDYVLAFDSQLYSFDAAPIEISSEQIEFKTKNIKDCPTD